MPEHRDLAKTLVDLDRLIKFAKDQLVAARRDYYLLEREIERLEQFLESHGVEVEKEVKDGQG